MSELVKWEAQLVTEKLGKLPAQEAASVIQEALPVVHKLLIHYHQVRITDILASL